MSRKPRTLEYEGEIYTSAVIAEKFSCHISWVQELMKDVEDEKRTPAQIFGLFKRHKKYRDRRNRKFVFKVKSARGRKTQKTFTMKQVIYATGLSEESAYRRLINAEEGKRDPETLLDAPRSKPCGEQRTRAPRGRLSHISSEMTPARKAAFRALRDAGNQNEFLRS